MGCGTSSDVLPNYIQPELTDEKPPAEKPPAEKPPAEKPPAEKLPAKSPAVIGRHLMFEVPINDEESLVKKHPPMRLQRLEEQQVTPPEITLEMLQKRQAEAEERRKRILDQRVQSAQQFQQKIRTPY